MNNRFTSPKVLATVEFVCALITVYLYRVWRYTERTEIAMIASILAIGLAMILVKKHAYGHSAIAATFVGIHPYMDWGCVAVILGIYIYRMTKHSSPKE